MDAKTIGNEPASPLELLGYEVAGRTLHIGLTKRELFAAMAMQGYVSAGCQGMPTPEVMASLAVRTADALLAELAKAGE